MSGVDGASLESFPRAGVRKDSRVQISLPTLIILQEHVRCEAMRPKRQPISRLPNAHLFKLENDFSAMVGFY